MGWLDPGQLRLSLGRPGGEGAAHQIAASCGCLCWQTAKCSFCFSSFPVHLLPPWLVSPAFFIFQHNPVLRCAGVSLCPFCVLSMPALLGAHHLLPASLGQPLWSGRGTEALPAWNTLLQLLFSYWTLLCLMRMFPWQSIPWFSGGKKKEPEGPSRENWFCFGWDFTEN